MGAVAKEAHVSVAQSNRVFKFYITQNKLKATNHKYINI